MLNGDADEFFASLNVRDPNRGSLWEKLLAALSGDRAHKWMYDTESLVRLLGRMNFADAQGMPPGLTSIPNVGALNLREREEESIYVEARKV
jgi:hypothetical protein